MAVKGVKSPSPGVMIFKLAEDDETETSRKESGSR
jgi:hypothetical protein